MLNLTVLNERVGAQTSITNLNNEGGTTMTIDHVFMTAAERALGNYRKNAAVDRMRKGIIRKDRVYVNKLVIASKGERSLKIQEQDSSVLLETVPTSMISVRKSNLQIAEAKYAGRLLSITCSEDNALLIDVLVTNGIWIEFDESGLRPVAAYGKTTNDVYLRIIGKNPRPQHADRLRHFQMLDYSPGDVKIKKWWAYNGTESERVSILHELTRGASEVQLFDPIDTGDSAKKIARISSMNSPSVRVNNDAKIGLFNAPFPTKEINGLDGLAFYDASKIRLGGLGESHLIGIGAQLRSRPLITKVFAVGLPHKLFVRMAEALIKLGKFYLPEGVSIEELDMITDSNGVKLSSAVLDHDTMTYTTTRKNELRLLDMPSKNPIKTSSQMLEKVLAINPVKGKTMILNVLREGIVDELTKRFEKIARIPTLGEVDDALTKTGIANLLLSIAPKALHKDKGLAYTVIDQTFDSIRNSVNKLAVYINESIYARAMADISYILFGESVVHFGEFFSNVDTDTAVFFKYPTMGTKEYYYAVNIKNVLKGRLMKIAGQDEEKIITASLLYEFYLSLHEGIVVMPNSEILRNLLAGFDFDFDGVAMVWDPLFLDIFKGQKPYVVSIEREKPKTVQDNAKKFLTGKGYRELKNTSEKRLIPLNSDLVIRTFKKQVLTDGKSIGQITNLNSTEIGLYLTITMYLMEGKKVKAKEYADIAKKMIAYAADITINGKAVYEPMDTTQVMENGIAMDNILADDDFGPEMYRRIRTCDLDNITNILNILSDLNVLRRRQQEGTIDSSKDGLVMKIDLWIERFRSKSLTPFSFNLDSETIEVSFARGYISPKTTVIEDIFSDLQDKLIKEVTEYGNFQFVPLYRDAGFSQKEFTGFSELIQQHSMKFANLSMVKYLYGKFNNVIMTDIGMTKDEEIKKDLGDKLSSLRDVLNGMVSATVSDLDIDTASTLVMATSSYSPAQRIFKNTRQRFGMKVSPELYFHYMLKNTPDAVTVEAERFYGDIADEENGVVVELVNGRVNDRFASGVTKTPFNGEVTITKTGDKCYAVRNIEVKRTPVDKAPVVITHMVNSASEGDLVIFVKEDTGTFKEYKAYRITVENGNITDSEILGTFDERSLVELSDFSKGIVKAYTVKDSIHDEHSVTVNGKENGYVFDCIFVS